MSDFDIWMSGETELCHRPMDERWNTDDLEKCFNAGKLELLEKIKMMFIADSKTFPIWIEKEIRKELER